MASQSKEATEKSVKLAMSCNTVHSDCAYWRRQIWLGSNHSWKDASAHNANQPRLIIYKCYHQKLLNEASISAC